MNQDEYGFLSRRIKSKTPIGDIFMLFTSLKYVNNKQTTLFNELCWGKAMVAYTNPQQRKKESDRLRGEGDKIKFIHLRFDSWQVAAFGKGKKARRSINCMFLQ